MAAFGKSAQAQEMEVMAPAPLQSERKIFYEVKPSCDASSDDEHSTSAGSEDERGSGSDGATATPATMSPAETCVEPHFDLVMPNDSLPAWITMEAPQSLPPPPSAVPPGFARLPWHRIGAEDESAEKPTLRPAPGLTAPMLPPNPTQLQLQVADNVAKIVLAAEDTSSSDGDMVVAPFDKVAFHKDLSDILRDLVCASNAGAAVQQIRAWHVPRELQAAEFTDLLTRAAEEGRGLARRRCFTLAAGLVAGTPSAFSKEECLKGVAAFFKEVYQSLCLEVPRLPAIAANEMVPTLAAVLPKKKLRSLLPRGLESTIAQGTR